MNSISLQALPSLAKESRLRAHAPYSHYLVGSAIRVSSGEIYGGCNVENASYGGTVCAERVAIWKAVSEKGAIQIDEILVVTDQAQGWPPCGFCRQVIAEFAHAQTKVHISNLQGVQKTMPFTELFPDGFRPEHLGGT